MKRPVQKNPWRGLEKDEKEVVLNELGKANLVISQFIRSCSHSMRGPLKSIHGILNLLKTTKASEVDTELMISLIEENTNKMENMLNDLEQFMFNTSKEGKYKQVDLDELIHSVAASYHREIEDQHISIAVQVNQSSPLYSDSRRIRLIVNHLIMNAITFQKPNESDRCIHIECTSDEEACVFRIEDNGIGIAPDQHENIFKIFYQATTNSKGAGIGLFVVQEALNKMKGTIKVESELGKGSAFIISIPNNVMVLSKK